MAAFGSRGKPAVDRSVPSLLRGGGFRASRTIAHALERQLAVRPLPAGRHVRLEQPAFLEEPQRLCQDPANPVRRPQGLGRHGGGGLPGQPSNDGPEQLVQSRLDGRPLRASPIHVGLVHRHGDVRQLDFADEAIQPLVGGWSRVAEPLGRSDEATQVEDADAAFGRARRGRVGQQSPPAADEPPACAHAERVSFLERPGAWCDRRPVHRHAHEPRLEERPVRLGQPLGGPPRLELSIDLADLDANVPERRLDRLASLVELVGPQPGPIPVGRVLETVCPVVARRRREDLEPVAQVPDGRLATLPVAPDPVSTPLRRGPPAQVVALDRCRAHPGPADGDDRQAAGRHPDLDLERPTLDTAVDCVVDELEQGVERGPVVREQGGRQARIDPLPNGAPRSHRDPPAASGRRAPTLR